MLGVLLGDLGSGKTALATGMAGDAVLAGKPVKSNYEIRWRGCEKFYVSDLLDLDVESGCIVCDEVYTLAESRISSSKLNRFFSYFIFQSRKLGVDVVSTAQLASSVDLRLIGLANLVVMCERNDPKRRFEYTFIKNGMKPKIDRRAISYEWMSANIFPYYNTYETVSALGVKDLQVELEKFDVERINRRVDGIVQMFLDNKFAGVRFDSEKDVMKYIVEDEMFRVGFPLVLSSFVVNRLKRRLRLG